MTTDAARVEGPITRRGSGLVRRTAQGDQSAFAAIVDEFGDGILRRALAILRDEADARDATQETLLRVWRDLPGLRSEERFEAWLDRILVNVCRDRLRHRGRIRVREIRPEIRVDGTEWYGSGFTDPHAGDDRRASIETAFKTLSVDDRSLLVLHHLESRSVADLASVMRVPVGTVKRRLHTARARLQRALDEESR